MLRLSAYASALLALIATLSAFGAGFPNNEGKTKLRPDGRLSKEMYNPPKVTGNVNEDNLSLEHNEERFERDVERINEQSVKPTENVETKKDHLNGLVRIARQSSRPINQQSPEKSTAEKVLEDIIKSHMQDLIRQNTEILASQSETKKSIEYLTRNYEDLLQQVSSLKNQSQAFLDRVSKVEANTENLDRRLRLSSLDLSNIRLKKKNYSKNVLLDVATSIFNEISVDVTTSDFYNILITHNQPTNQSELHNVTIVCRFNSVILKNKILEAFKEYNRRNPKNKLSSTIVGGSNHPIHIAENLTPHASRLFDLACEYAKEKKYKHCYTSYGQVLLRETDSSKIITVTSEDQLSGS